MKCALHIGDSTKHVTNFSETSWTTLLSVVHLWANDTGDTPEAAICKEIIQCYGLEVIRPLDVIIEKRVSLGYHHKCYSRLTNVRTLFSKIKKRTRETAEIGKYRNIVINL